MIDYNTFRGLHYNGVQLIDFSYGSNDYEEKFLEYFKIFTHDAILPGKHKIIDSALLQIQVKNLLAITHKVKEVVDIND